MILKVQVKMYVKEGREGETTCEGEGDFDGDGEDECEGEGDGEGEDEDDGERYCEASRSIEGER